MSPMALFSAITVVVTSIVAAVIEPHTPTEEGVVLTPYVEESGAAPRERPSAVTMAFEHHERISEEVVKPLQERPRMEAMSRIALPRERHVSYVILERADRSSTWMPFEIREETLPSRLFRVRTKQVKLVKADGKAPAAPAPTYARLADGRLHLETGEIQLRLRGEAKDAWLSTKEAVARMRLLR